MLHEVGRESSIEKNNFWTQWIPGESVWVSRLTTGIYLVCGAINAKYVVVPNNCCPQIVYAIVLAGAIPVFCEINIDTGGLEVSSFKELTNRYRIDMVIHIHLFGIYCDRGLIQEICYKHGVFLFEDGGLWFPPIQGYEVSPNSCLGLSFGSKKIFDFDGGALVVFAEKSKANLVKKLSELLPRVADRLPDYSEAYYHLIRVNEPIESLAFTYRDSWIGKPAVPEIMLTASQVITEHKRRERLAILYQHSLLPLNAKFFSEHQLNFHWRFSFLSTKSKLIARNFRLHGLDVSHWYPALDNLFNKYPASVRLENSRRLEKEVCNLWLDDSIDERTIELLRKAVEEIVEMET